MISFENTQIAYNHLSDKNLRKAYYLFRAMSIGWLVEIGNSLIVLFLKLGIPIQGIIKKTIYSQFCGGETLDETIPLINFLKESDIEVLLNYSVEGLDDNEGYRDTFEKALFAIQFAKENTSIRAICIKFTGFANISIWTKLQNNENLTEDEEKEYFQAKSYIERLCAEAVKCDVHIYVDAEESWFQDSIDDLVDEMMAKFNREEAFIFNTYQLYRKDKFEYFKASTEKAKKQGYILGAKIVRGAYVEKENDYYEDKGEPSPLNTSKQASDEEFNKAVIYAVENIDVISLCCASHNEASNELYYKELISRNIPLNHSHVNSSQLLGMSDNITFNLAEKGVSTAKYVPYGPINEVIPYLMRRAQENTSVEGQTGRELLLLKRELKRRKL